jgi:hypothetical protein
MVIERYYEREVSLVTPSIGYNGWRFVATLNFEQGGTVVRTVPGEELGGYRPADQVCDQCHTVRERLETFVVRNDVTGEYKQVGRNCLALFFGIKPSLWIYELGIKAGEGGPARIEVESVRNIVAAALAVSKGGAGYVSKAAAEFGGESTATDARACLYEVVYGTGPDAKERQRQLGEWRSVQWHYLNEDTTTVDAVIEAAQAITGHTDYAENVRVLAASEYVSVKNIGFVASFVAVYNRAIQREAEHQVRAARVQEFIGQVGDKKVTTTGTVVAKRFIEGAYGTTTLIEWLTDEGLTCKWFSSNALEVVEGDRITVNGTIKKHDEYQGRKATVFTRCGITVEHKEEVNA